MTEPIAGFARNPTAPDRGIAIEGPDAQRGFTLIEILIVVAIIGVIAGIAIPGLLTAFDRARQAGTVALMRGYSTALQAYATDNQNFPLTIDVATLLPLLAPYSDRLRSADDWHHPLSYTSDGEHYSLVCFGKDGVDGGDISPQTRYIFALDIVMADGYFSAGLD
jgi:general secretion pathway protein G